MKEHKPYEMSNSQSKINISRNREKTVAYNTQSYAIYRGIQENKRFQDLTLAQIALEKKEKRINNRI